MLKPIDKSTKRDKDWLKSALRIMQSIFTEGKKQIQICKEVNLKPGYVSETINTLESTGLVCKDKVNRIYFVPIESITREFAGKFECYNEENIERLIKVIRKRSEEISNKYIEEGSLENAKLIRSYPSLMFMVLLTLGSREVEWGEYEVHSTRPWVMVKKENDEKHIYNMIYSEDYFLWRFIARLLLIASKNFVNSIFSGFGFKKLMPETTTLFNNAMKRELENLNKFEGLNFLELEPYEPFQDEEIRRGFIEPFEKIIGEKLGNITTINGFVTKFEEERDKVMKRAEGMLEVFKEFGKEGKRAEDILEVVEEFGKEFGEESKEEFIKSILTNYKWTCLEELIEEGERLSKKVEFFEKLKMKILSIFHTEKNEEEYPMSIRVKLSSKNLELLRNYF